MTAGRVKDFMKVAQVPPPEGGLVELPGIQDAGKRGPGRAEGAAGAKA